MRSIFLVARRDYIGYVTSFGFWVGMLLTPILMGVGALVPSFVQNAQSVRYFAVVEVSGDTFTKELDRQIEFGVFNDAKPMIRAAVRASGQDPDIVIQGLEDAFEAGTLQQMMERFGSAEQLNQLKPKVHRVEIPARTSEEISEFMLAGTLVDGPAGPKEVTSVVFVAEDGKTVEYWKEHVGGGILPELRSTIKVLAQRQVFEEAGVDLAILKSANRARAKLKEKVPRAAEEGVSADRTIKDSIPRIVSIAIAIFLWIMIFSVVNYLLMGTIEERSNKIFDTLLTSVKLPQLLAGKLLAVLAVSLTLMGFWLIGGTLFTTYMSSSLTPGMVGNILTGVAEAVKPTIIIPALISFILGYLIYGSLFLAIGSLCDTVQEAQTLMTPMLFLLMAPLLAAALSIENPASQTVAMMAWFPLFTPFLLILRMPTDPPMWEVLAQMGLMLFATVLILWFATRVYRAGAVNGAGMSDVAAWFGKFVPGRKSKAR